MSKTEYLLEYQLKNQINEFNNKSNYKEELQEELNKLNENNKDFNQYNLLHYIDKPDELKKYTKNQTEINNLEDKINEIDNHSEEINFFEKSYEYLYNYMDKDNMNMEFNNNILKKHEMLNSIDKTNNNNLLGFFNKQKVKQNDQANIKYLIIKEYNNFINNNLSIYTPNICPQCNQELFIDYTNGYVYCNICGMISKNMINTVNYEQEVNNEKQNYPYKRLNHFIEWLNQFQGKETINTPEYVYNDIIKELEKINITDKKDITIPVIKNILRKLNYQKYYDHISFIITKITGNHPPLLDRATEEYLKVLFKKIEKSFNKVCPSNRNNFLSYSYVLNKIFQLHGNNNMSEYFPLLKSRDKLKYQDEIWKKICEDLNWVFYPSL